MALPLATAGQTWRDGAPLLLLLWFGIGDGVAQRNERRQIALASIIGTDCANGPCRTDRQAQCQEDGANAPEQGAEAEADICIWALPASPWQPGFRSAQRRASASERMRLGPERGRGGLGSADLQLRGCACIFTQRLHLT